MLLAWRDPHLEVCCSQQAALDLAAGASAEDARDLLTVVSESEPFGVLLRFQSIRFTVCSGAVDMSLGVARLRTRLLTPRGEPVRLGSSTLLHDHAPTTALVVDDLAVRGRSLSRLAG